MANLYGVANAPGQPIFLSSSNFLANPTCPAGVWTTVCTSPAMIAPSAGWFYAFLNMTFVVQTGASTPSNLFAAAAIGAGSYSISTGMTCAGFGASTYVNWSVSFCTVASQSAWQGGGSVINIGIEPLTNAVTINQFSCGSLVLLRAQDQ